MSRNLSRSFFVRWKTVLQFLRPFPKHKQLLFIVGCQRSGTTLLSRVFEKDHNTKIYEETSKLSGKNPNSRLRLNPLTEIEVEIRKERASLLVLKPLVETQNILKLLKFFPSGKAVWIYRHFKDVAASNIVKFGPENGIKDLRLILENDTDNWRAENVSDSSRSLVQSHYQENMDPGDAAVLFWIVRNRLFRELQLDTNPSVFVCKYEHLAANPTNVMRSIYDFMGQHYPGDFITSETHTDSIRKGVDLELSPAIEQEASQLLARLDEAAYRGSV